MINQTLIGRWPLLLSLIASFFLLACRAASDSADEGKQAPVESGEGSETTPRGLSPEQEMRRAIAEAMQDYELRRDHAMKMREQHGRQGLLSGAAGFHHSVSVDMSKWSHSEEPPHWPNDKWSNFEFDFSTQVLAFAGPPGRVHPVSIDASFPNTLLASARVRSDEDGTYAVEIEFGRYGLDGLSALVDKGVNSTTEVIVDWRGKLIQPGSPTTKMYVYLIANNRSLGGFYVNDLVVANAPNTPVVVAKGLSEAHASRVVKWLKS